VGRITADRRNTRSGKREFIPGVEADRICKRRRRRRKGESEKSPYSSQAHLRLTLTHKLRARSCSTLPPKRQVRERKRHPALDPPRDGKKTGDNSYLFR